VSLPTAAKVGSDFWRRGEVLFMRWQGADYQISAVDPLGEALGSATAEGSLSAPMNGSIVRILVAPGEAVQAGDGLIVVEAMKMEHTLRAPRAGTVSAIFCTEGEMVAEGLVLAELEDMNDDAA
jgi:3-methylcrotonyl-CoA carboxylase alpha subunit